MKLLTSIAFILVAFWGCMKSNSSFSEGNDIVASTVGCEITSFEINNLHIGLEHNNLCDFILSRIDCSHFEGNTDSVIFSLFVNNDTLICNNYGWNLSEYNLLINDLQGSINTNTYFDSNFVLSITQPHPFVDSFQIYVNYFTQFMNTVDFDQNVSDVHQSICVFNNSLDKSSFNSLDSFVFNMMIDVAYSSSIFWMPVDLGGENKYHNLNNWYNSNCDDLQLSAILRFDWGKLISIDAVSLLTAAAGSVIHSGGATALPNPAFGGLPTASVYGLVIGAGSSCIYAIGAN